MPSITYLTDLYQKMVYEYTKTPSEWLGLLSCVARFYKYSFDNVVLIYAQRPNAIQLATYQQWNSQLINRRINYGSKGIAVIDMDNPKASLKYLFDLMDTNGSPQSLKKQMTYLWDLEEQYWHEMLSVFHARYHIAFPTVEECLYELAKQQVAINISDYIKSFEIGEKNSILHDFPYEAVKDEFIQIVTDSVAYVIFQKCNVSSERFINCFQNISHFNSLELFMALGNCTIFLARPILQTIYQDIQNVKLERGQNYEKRVVNEHFLLSGEGRNDVSNFANIKESTDRQFNGGQIRYNMEELHDGTLSSANLTADLAGENKRSDTTSGRQSRERQGNINTEFSQNNTFTRNRKSNRTNTAHDKLDFNSGGNDFTPDNTGNSIILSHNKSFIDEKILSESDFFVVPVQIDSDNKWSDDHAIHDKLNEMKNEKNDDKTNWLKGSIDVFSIIEPISSKIQMNVLDEIDSAMSSHNISINEQQSLFVGKRFYYNDQVYEIIRFLDDKQTVEIGDVSQLEDIYDFKVTEIVSIFDIVNCQLVKEDYTIGKLANIVNNISRNEDVSNTIEVINADKITMQSDYEYNQTITEDFFTRLDIKKTNYQYNPEHRLYDGGPKEKCKNNIKAIQLLKELQEDQKLATYEQQITLAKYVGWGGLANALTPNIKGWEKEYDVLKQLLSDLEFESIQKSTVTAYYTDQSIINHIYTGLTKFGFKGGNILDPAMGTGNFFSVLPESMKNSKLYGVELDLISGDIARQLFPNASIEVKGFEDTTFPDQFFDVVLGNVPFNSIKVDDARYNKYNFRIHDYFIAKSLDKTRPGGLVAIIVSKYTMDKLNSSVRKYIAQRAELLGAIRLPNNAFMRIAGTKATTDILFLKKREREIVPDIKNTPWLSIEQNEDGIPINSYFINHPEMILGKMVFDGSMFGNEKSTACYPTNDNLNESLERAISYIEGEYKEAKSENEIEEDIILESIPADPKVRNYSYTLVDDSLYFRENSRMFKQNNTGKKAERIKGMVKITDAVRNLIDFQNGNYDSGYDLSTMEYNNQLKIYMDQLNQIYDSFVSEYGALNNYGNIIAFSKDINAPLLRSIEKESSTEKGVWEKTTIFFKATIKPKVIPSVVSSAEEALKVSLNVKGKIDLDYMTLIYQLPDHRKTTPEEIIQELGDHIYQDPDKYTGNPYSGWILADEYLSGHVKDKLVTAILKAEDEPERFSRNVDALKMAQPTPLNPEDISFTLTSSWIPADDIQTFMYETFKTNAYNMIGSSAITLEYSKYNGSYHITNKKREYDSVTVNKTYGTERLNAYEILEITLNSRFAEVKDSVKYNDPITGEEKVKYVINQKETILAREKQAEIKFAFENWLFADPNRGLRLTKLYNDKFNDIRPRVYDGSHLTFPDMNTDIKFKKHQIDAIAHGLYGEGNLLIAHSVGAGKTYAAIALTYEMKRLGIVHKPLIVVPNHLIGHWADSYMKLYPNADILVADKKDLERKNRRRFVSRIATGDYNAVIMAQSSFELINMSTERQLSIYKTEIDEISAAIIEQKRFSGDKDWSLKQMMIFKSNLQYHYDRLFNAEKKDDVINFEELGVDALVVDEAHVYKNNFSYTKMHNVAGISSVSSQRAMDMHLKCQYINEIGNGKGVIYLTGTPISNSMAELYVLQKTLQPQELARRDMLLFDSWAGNFGKVVSSLEIKPEGNGYQMKNRFAQFCNLPELMSMFFMIVDIKNSDMLNLPVPKLKNDKVTVIETKITPEQKHIVMKLAERAEAIRNGYVDNRTDNFLKLTHEARLLAIDPRALDPNIPFNSGTKLNVCACNVKEIYDETKESKGTQLIFCDQGTPKYDGSFSFYESMKDSLIAQGIKSEEVAFIHDAKTNNQREILFEKIRRGEVRVLMGSTEKMGTGMNVQDKMVAVHHLDVPWRPSDLTQRNGRILRQGNTNDEVSILNYITENTFDAYLWQILEQKQRFISQIMTGQSALRTCEDIDETVLQYAHFKAMAISDPRIKEKIETDNEISRLILLKSSWQSQRNKLQNEIIEYKNKITKIESRLVNMTKDIALYSNNKPSMFRITIDGKLHNERTVAAEHFMVCAQKLPREVGSMQDIGNYAGFEIYLRRSSWNNDIILRGADQYTAEMGDSELGNITRIENLAERIEQQKITLERQLENLILQLEIAKEEIKKAFPNEEKLKELQKKKVELDLTLEFSEECEVDNIMNNNIDETSHESKFTLAQHLYKKLMVFAAPILNDEANYMLFKSEGFDDLVLEGSYGEYSIAHYYMQNAKRMRDPEIGFIVDWEDKSIYPTFYIQDNMGITYQTDDSRELLQDTSEFMLQWFINIADQGYQLIEMKCFNEENLEQNELDR